MIRYIYLFSDGTFKWCSQGPTEADKEAVRDGELRVLRVKKNEIDELNRQFDELIWVILEEAEIGMVAGQEWHE